MRGKRGISGHAHFPGLRTHWACSFLGNRGCEPAVVLMFGQGNANPMFQAHFWAGNAKPKPVLMFGQGSANPLCQAHFWRGMRTQNPCSCLGRGVRTRCARLIFGRGMRTLNPCSFWVGDANLWPFCRRGVPHSAAGFHAAEGVPSVPQSPGVVGVSLRLVVVLGISEGPELGGHQGNGERKTSRTKE